MKLTFLKASKLVVTYLYFTSTSVIQEDKYCMQNNRIF